MAVTFTTADQIDRITVSATIGKVTKVTLENSTRTVTVQGFDSGGTIGTACKVALSGTDDAAIGADFWTVPAGVSLEIPLENERGRSVPAVIYIASSVASGIIEVWASKVGV